MRRVESRTQTFSQILRRLETQNAERLIEKARTANRIAKSAPDGRARRRAYRVKVEALLRLRRQFSARTSVATDPRIPAFIIVRYDSPQTGPRCGLHAPMRDFVC